MEFQDLLRAISIAEAHEDLEGCVACQIQMLEMTKEHPELLRTNDTTYLRIDYLMRILAAAVVAYGRGEWKLARYYLQAFPAYFLQRPGCFPEHRVMLGRLAYEEGNLEQATEFLEAHLERYPQDEMAWFWLGNTAYRRKQFHRAVSAYTHALQRKNRFQEAEENRAEAFQMMCSQNRQLALLKTPIAQTSVDEEDWRAVRQLPIFINCRDRVGGLSQLVDWLLQAGYENLVLLDNDSTYVPLLQYYEDVRSDRVRVVMLGENLGYTALWESGVLELLGVATPYVYTDPDVLPTETCPQHFLQDYLRILAMYPAIQKVGAALRYDDVTYAGSAQVKEPESCYYHAPLGVDAYFANVDTTFALYRNVRFYHRGPAIRMAGRYAFRHLPWYYDYANLPEDEVYYLSHANASSTMGIEMKAMVHGT